MGTSLALAIPLLMLRKRGRAARVSLKGSVVPPTRNAQASARLPQATVTPAASSSEPIITSLREEIETPSAGEMMSALARMNASSALMAAKAFGIATALVLAGAGGLAWTVRTTMDVHDVRLFVIIRCFPVCSLHPDSGTRVRQQDALLFVESYA